MKKLLIAAAFLNGMAVQGYAQDPPDITVVPGEVFTIPSYAPGPAGAQYQWRCFDISIYPLPGATATSYSGSLTAVGIYEFFRETMTPGVCDEGWRPSNSYYVKVVCPANWSVTAGNAQTINYNTAPAALTATPSNSTGGISYQWYSGLSADAATAPISGATASTYAPGTLNTTTYYSVNAWYTESTCATATATPVAITVLPQVAAGRLYDSVFEMAEGEYANGHSDTGLHNTSGDGNIRYERQPVIDSREAAQAIAPGAAQRNGIPAPDNKGRSPVSERLTPFQGLPETRCSQWSQGFTRRCCLRGFAPYKDDKLLLRQPPVAVYSAGLRPAEYTAIDSCLKGRTKIAKYKSNNKRGSRQVDKRQI
jgi:hypothetical protein